MKRRCQHGVSQLEVVLVIAVLLILIGSALRQVSVFSEQSEQMQVEEVLGSVRTSINTLVSEHLLADTMYKLQAYDGSNPVQLLVKKPTSYQGERGDTELLPAVGQWYFHVTRKHFIYRMRDIGKLKELGFNLEQLSFRLNLMYRDKNNNHRYDQGIDDAQGLALEPVYPYQWRLE